MDDIESQPFWETVETVETVVALCVEAGGLLVWCEREIEGENAKGRKGRTHRTRDSCQSK